MRELYLIIFAGIVIFGCNNNQKVESKKQESLSESGIPNTYPFIINHKDSITVGEKFIVKATTNNDYIFRLAQQNKKQNYLQAYYAIGFDSIKVFNNYNPTNKAIIKGDTALIEVELPKEEIENRNKYFCRIVLKIDYSDKYPSADTIWPIIHSFNIKEK